MASRYQRLTQWLVELRESEVAEVMMAFSDIERLVGVLPASARSTRSWWGNTPRSQANAWLSAGWVVTGVDTRREVVTFAVGERTRRESHGKQPVLDGRAALEALTERAGWPSLAAAVAAHAVFLHPATVAQSRRRAVFPVVRDPARRGQIGELPDGRTVVFDDNSTPTDVFLWAADRSKGPDVQFTHIWTRATDPDSYTALWNLCCTPAFLAKTTDTHADVVALLKYRAYELYGYVPEGVDPPRKPDDYDDVRWATAPEPVVDLEALLRRRMRAAPGRRAVLAARRIGWLFSDGPDPAL